MERARWEETCDEHFLRFERSVDRCGRNNHGEAFRSAIYGEYAKINRSGVSGVDKSG